MADLLRENFVAASGYRVHGRIADRNGVGIAGSGSDYALARPHRP